MEVDIRRIANALGVTARTACRRAARESWPYRMSALREARGDQSHRYARRSRTRHRLYPVERLPADVREALGS